MNKLIKIILAFSLIGGFFIRVYRVDQILGFYFDQGRDALVVWDFLQNGKLFLIGPTTGIAGIFRGPFYYYLIAPFYWLGRGDPVWPAVFLAFTSVLASFCLYKVGVKIHSKQAGIFAVIISSFSFYIVLASRWLSNPTPMLLLSSLLLLSMIAVNEGKRRFWVVIAILSGVSLFHFGSSGEFFYLPAIFVFFLWQLKKKNGPSLNIFLLSAVAFLATSAPLILFDLRHDFILSNNIKKFFVDDQSFKSNFWDVAKLRFSFYYDVFTSKIFESRLSLEKNLLAIVGLSFLLLFRRLNRNTNFRSVLILFLAPIIGLLFFQGNEGNIYDYYLTGYYLVFIVLFSAVLGEIWKFKIGKLFVAFFIYLFLSRNLEIIKPRITAGVDGPETIAFGNQKMALDWIYEDSKGEAFSTDVYVPPVIPYAYDYLFNWYGASIKGKSRSNEPIDPLYTLYEVDPPHPERLEAWMKRQEGIGKVEKEAKFGGITVQRRKRIND